MIAAGAGMFLLALVLVPLLPSPFARGLYLGSFATAIAALLAFHVVQATGTASTMMGDEAEQWTAQELRKLSRRGWRLINHVSLRGRDIDHVLVGPGGAFAVETKWSAHGWRTGRDDGRVTEACIQAAGNAQTLSLWLKKHGVATVAPVVFLWGAGTRDLPPIQTVGSGNHYAVVVAGPSCGQWIDALPAGELDRGQVDGVWETLSEYCDRRDPRELEEAPLPPSIVELVQRAFVVFFSATTAFFAATWLLSHRPSEWWWLFALIAVAVPGVALLRVVRRARYIAWGWLAGVAVSCVTVVYALARWLIETVT